jgi:hypothetical protein
VEDPTLSGPVVSNLWYGYVADWLGACESNTGNGGKHKKGVKIKTSYEVLVYKFV